MDTKNEVTIYDIASKLSLSPATVSRALNNSKLVNKQTLRKVQLLAESLNYRQNNFASNLRKQKTNTIGVILHELNSNFITSVLAGIEKVTAKAGFDIIITHSSENKEKEIANASNLFHKRVDGVIASLSFTTKDLKHFEQFKSKGIPVIFFDRVDEESNYPKVIIDNFSSGYRATQHLIDQGCQRIAMVTSNLSRNVYMKRHSGYVKALKDNKLNYEKELVFIKDLSEQSAIKVAKEIVKMKPMPDGMFVTNDFSCAVCMSTLKKSGIKIPEDIAVVGFNNDAIGKLIEPQLTTINYPGREIGEIAARIIINHLKEVTDIKLTNTFIINSELIIRESSLKKSKDN